MNRAKQIIPILCCLLFLVSCKPQEPPQTQPPKGTQTMTIKVTSTAFEEGEMIPPKHTADGMDVSPPLAWTGLPEGTQSVALINDDPDAPMGTWVHWLVWNIPPSVPGWPFHPHARARWPLIPRGMNGRRRGSSAPLRVRSHATWNDRDAAREIRVQGRPIWRARHANFVRSVFGEWSDE